MDRIVRLPLAPLLLAQALRTRKNALQLPEAAGPREGQVGHGRPLRLLILGDSSGAGVGVDHQDQALAGHLTRDLARDFSVEWRVLARNGATSADALTTLPHTPPMDVAVLALGVNDVTRLTSPTRFTQLHARLFDQLKDKGASLVCVTDVPPMGKFPLLPNPLRWILGRHADRLQKARAQELSARPGYRAITFDLPTDPSLMARDGFHPGPEIYRHWGQTTANLIREHFQA